MAAQAQTLVGNSGRACPNAALCRCRHTCPRALPRPNGLKVLAIRPQAPGNASNLSEEAKTRRDMILASVNFSVLGATAVAPDLRTAVNSLLGEDKGLQVCSWQTTGVGRNATTCKLMLHMTGGKHLSFSHKLADLPVSDGQTQEARKQCAGADCYLN